MNYQYSIIMHITTIQYNVCVGLFENILCVLARICLFEHRFGTLKWQIFRREDDVKRWNGRPSEKSEKNSIRTQHVYRVIPFCWVRLTSQNSQVPHRYERFDLLVMLCEIRIECDGFTAISRLLKSLIWMVSQKCPTVPKDVRALDFGATDQQIFNGSH